MPDLHLVEAAAGAIRIPPFLNAAPPDRLAVACSRLHRLEESLRDSGMPAEAAAIRHVAELLAGDVTTDYRRGGTAL
jgi:hypothetical protein